MVASRVFYNNLLTTLRFSSFNTAGGAVAMADANSGKIFAYNVGSVAVDTRLNPTTGYTAPLEKNFIVAVQSSTDGTFPNTRWRWGYDGVTWVASNLTPVSGNWVALSDGVEVQFTSGSTSPQFGVADAWEWRTVRRYGIAKALDGSRNSEYRSGTLQVSSTIRTGWDLGSSQLPTCFVLDDHNIPSNAVTTLWGNSSLFTESGGFSQICTWRANRIVELITPGAFRYWWWKVVLPASGLPAYLRWSEAFLGTGATLTQCPDIGPSNDLNWLGSIDVETATRGPHPRVYTAAEPQYTWSLVKPDATEDGGKLEAALAYARDHASYQMPPLWFLLRDDVLSSLEVYSWVGSGLQRAHRFLDRWDYRVQWAQVIRTVAS